MSDISFPPGLLVAAEPLGDVTLTYQATLALASGNRQVSVPLAGVKAGDVLSARPVGVVPTGYDIGAAYCMDDGTLVVIINHPALTLLQTFSVVVRVFRIVTHGG